ncbi:MAG: TIGR04372 family glycosyltransferase, partial [bacterium]|nr:TIGR04372 family glycosyltransferase [bacterium]
MNSPAYAISFDAMPASSKRGIGASVVRRLWAAWSTLAKHVVAPLARVVRLLGWNVRFVRFEAQSIGHLAIEPDIYLKERALGLREDFQGIWVARFDRIANRALFDHWASKIRLVRWPFLSRLLLPFAKDPVLGYSTRNYVFEQDGNAGAALVLSRWKDRGPVAPLSELCEARGEAALRELGIPEGAWFVCFHSREAGYWGNFAQTFRDSEIESYVPAMRAVTTRGGYAVRMGDPTSQNKGNCEGVVMPAALAM